MSNHVQPGTIPDVNRLWHVGKRVDMAQVDALGASLRWRMRRCDWRCVQAQAPTHAIETRFTVDGIVHELHGLPVEIVECGPDCPQRWPELVIVCDYRVIEPEETKR